MVNNHTDYCVKIRNKIKEIEDLFLIYKVNLVI